MIYLDTCLVIHALEDFSERGAHVRRLLSAEDLVTAISPMVIMESLAGTLRRGDEVMTRRYEGFFELCRRIPLIESTFRRAAEISASHGLRAPGSLHLGAAQNGGCDAIWTNDRRLSHAADSFARDVLA